MKAKAATALLLVLSCSSPLFGTPAPRPRLPANHDLWIRVGRCEQPGRGYRGIAWNHHGPRYQGGLGFARSSWIFYKPKGYPTNAGDATWRQQMTVANRLWARAGWGWGCDMRW